MKKFYRTNVDVQVKPSKTEFAKAIAAYSDAGSDEQFFVDLRGLIEKQPDLLYGLSILVSEGSNANDDGFLRRTLADIFKTPRNKFVDFEHDVDALNIFKNPNKYKVVGHIYDSSLTTQDGTIIPDDAVTPDVDGEYFDAESNFRGKPLDITVAWVLYKFQYPELAQMVESRFESNDNATFGVSMEVLFTDYKYRVGDFSAAESFDFDATTIGATEARKGGPLFDKLEELWKKRFKYNGEKITRILGGEIFFSGMAITKNRANGRSWNLSIANAGQIFIDTEKETMTNKELLSLVKSVASKNSSIDLDKCEIVGGKLDCGCNINIGAASQGLENQLAESIGALITSIDRVYEQTEAITKRKDVSPKSGEHKYGDVKFADPKNKKYPIDTEEHIRAAWNYINKEHNAGEYSSEDVSSIKSRIVSAWKEKIDKEGPPSAKKAKAAYSCAMCDSGAPMDQSHTMYHVNAAQNGLILAQQKLQNLYENNIDNDLSADEVLEFVEEIQSLVTDSESALRM